MDRCATVLSCIALAFLLSASAWAQVDPPDLISFQGILRDSAGEPLSGTFDMVFSFYDADSGGNVLWREEFSSIVLPQITIDGGLFTATLGDTFHKTSGSEPDLHTLFGTYSDVYLGIQIGVDSEMAPLIQVFSKAYAKNTWTLGGYVLSDFSLSGHTHVLATGADDVTATAAELNKMSGVGPTVTAANLTSLTDGSNADTLHNHNFVAPCDAAFLRCDIDDTASEKITFTGRPGSTSWNAGSVVINPSSASFSESLLGLAVGSSPVLVIPVSGYVDFPGTLKVGDNVSSSSDIPLDVDADYTSADASGSSINITSQAGTGTVIAVKATAEATLANNTVDITVVEGRNISTTVTDGDRCGIKGIAGPGPSNGIHYGVFSESASGAWDDYGFYTPNDAHVGNFEINAQLLINGYDPLAKLYMRDDDRRTTVMLGYDDKNANYFTGTAITSLGDGISTLYAIRVRTSESSGSGYALGACNKAIEGFSIRGDTYSYGVYGFAFTRAAYSSYRVGGILGARNDVTHWGALGYLASNLVDYGGYFTAYTTGSGKSTQSSGIGSAGYGDVMGGWVKGEKNGLFLDGPVFGSYTRGDSYISGIQAFPAYDDRSVTHTYSLTSSTIDIMSHGTGSLKKGRAHISFPLSFARLASRQHPIDVVCSSLNGDTTLVVKAIDTQGFTVSSTADKDTVDFSWIAFAIRAGYENVTVPSEITSREFEDNMEQVTFNESDAHNRGLGIYHDGELHFGEPPEDPAEKYLDECLEADDPEQCLKERLQFIRTLEFDHTGKPIEIAPQENSENPSPQFTHIHSQSDLIPVKSEIDVGDIVVANTEAAGYGKRSSQSSDPAVLGIVSSLKRSSSDSFLVAIAPPGSVTYCKVDARFGPIQIGDLLTTSTRPGHAMKADKPELGTIIGKALEELSQGSATLKVIALAQ